MGLPDHIIDEAQLLSMEHPWKPKPSLGEKLHNLNATIENSSHFRRLAKIMGGLSIIMAATGVAHLVQYRPETAINLQADKLVNSQAPAESLQPSAGDRRAKIRVPRSVVPKPTTTTAPKPQKQSSTTSTTTIPPVQPFVIKGHGIDISFPQCGRTGKDGSIDETQIKETVPTNVDFAIIGINHGSPFTENQCLVSEAKTYNNVAYYVNSAYTGKLPPHEEGYQAGKDAVMIARKYGLKSTWWFIDVEHYNSWSKNEAANRASLQGEIEAIKEFASQDIGKDVTVALYSNRNEWQATMGNSQADPAVAHWKDMPNWYAGGFHDEPMPWARRHCTETNFTGGTNTPIVQQLPDPALPNPDRWDPDFSCK